MKKYTVFGTPARFGEGALLGLKPAQFATRSHNVTALPAVEQTIEGFTIVRANRPLEFRTGEEILVEGEEATKALVDPISGQKTSSAERSRTARKKAAKKTAAKAPAKGKR